MEAIYNNLVQLLTYDPQSPIIFSSGLFLVLFVGFTLVYYLLHNTFTPRILSSRCFPTISTTRAAVFTSFYLPWLQ